MNENTPILQCKHLVKSYGGNTPVLKDFNISLPEGRILGLLGPNGCGKSTFLKLVAGILTPDSGSIEICGQGRSEETNKLISYLPERTYFNSSMRVFELISFFADFYDDFDPAVAEKCLRTLIFRLTESFPPFQRV